MNKNWMLLFGLLLLTMACNLELALPWQPTQPTQVASATSTRRVVASPSPQAALASPTSAPKPTRTPTLTPVPVPSRTPVTPTEVLPTPPAGRLILIEYFDKYGGDAPWMPPDAYIGRHLPRLVIYTDGQLIWRDDAGALWESSMSKDAMCTLVGGMEKFGLFKVEGDGTLEADDPIYEKIPADRLNDSGFVNFLLVVNGNPAKWVIIYRPFVDSLVRPVKSSWELFNSFKPSDIQPYEPELYVMWIEAQQKLARSYGAGADLQPADWPRDLPKLNKLLGDNDAIQIPLDSSEVHSLLKYYDPAPGVKLFKEGKDRYSVILRPLLPHEELNNLSPVPQVAQRFALPFKCPK